MSITNATNLYAETLFILQYLPSGACQSGLWPAHLVALYGDISDSTFDGTSTFGPLPAGAWTAKNDIYLYHGAECAAFGVNSGTAGPGDYYATIPADAVHLLSVPLSGSGIGVSEAPVFQAFSNVALAAGDCIVTLWGLQGGGGFDNETQIFALVGP